jgi:1,6-anhydro-N-acetylmuramate kinase
MNCRLVVQARRADIALGGKGRGDVSKRHYFAWEKKGRHKDGTKGR